MADRADVAKGRRTVARWCTLAEARLAHLTELFETGRWRRYYTELAFLQDIREAKAAVETWQDLLQQEASPDKSALNKSLPGRPPSASPREPAVPPQPQRLEAPAEPPRRVAPVAPAIKEVRQQTVAPARAREAAPRPQPQRMQVPVEAPRQAAPIAATLEEALMQALAPAGAREPVARQPQRVETPVEPPRDVARAIEKAPTEVVAAATSTPDLAPMPRLDLAAMQERYPLLRNSL